MEYILSDDMIPKLYLHKVSGKYNAEVSYLK